MESRDFFPFERVLRFDYVADEWRRLASTGSERAARHARAVLDALEATPELHGPIRDLSVVDRHRELVEDLLSIVVPPAMQDDPSVAFAAIIPYKLQAVYQTASMRQLGLLDNWYRDMMITGITATPKEMNTGRAMNAYHQVLVDIYDVDAAFAFPAIFRRRDETNGLDRYYKVHLNRRFGRIIAADNRPELTPETIRALRSRPMDLAFWIKTLPPEYFEFHGFYAMYSADVTPQEAHSQLKNELFGGVAFADIQAFDRIQNILRTLLRRPQLQLGVVGLRRDDFGGIDGARAFGRSLLLADGGPPACPMREQSAYAQMFERDEVLVLGDLAACAYCTGFEMQLQQQGIRSVLIAPLRVGGRLIGLLELGSPVAGDLVAYNGMQLQEAIAMFATGLQRVMDDESNRVQAELKRQYTAVHPVVEWRFRSEVEDLLARRRANPDAGVKPIVFPDVFPLYGLSDIRSSSDHRNAAIQADLVDQLGLALAAVVEASAVRPLPALDELGFRVSGYVDLLEQGLTSDLEFAVLEFLRGDVEPLFDRVARFGPAVAERVAEYRAAIDNELGIVYRQRRMYDESVAAISESISAFLDRRDAEAQTMFPHYFEKYKSDGVDYNIYVGDSLVEDQTFDPLFVRNLRLWQLIATCGIVWELSAVSETLPMSLETAHLILVQTTPLSIRFRQDEKKFDVDGAYNARYAIVKKRIDKALVKGSDERVTQPGQIAIVYAHPREAVEYRRYIDYLRSAGYFVGTTEELDVEDLQGVIGLKALRVKVADRAPDAEVRSRPMEALRLAGGDGLPTMDLEGTSA